MVGSSHLYSHFFKYFLSTYCGFGILLYVYTIATKRYQNTTIMKACQAIANQINAHIEDLKENNEFIDESFYIVKEYFWNHDLPIDSMLFNSTLDLIK